MKRFDDVVILKKLNGKWKGAMTSPNVLKYMNVVSYINLSH